MGRSTPALQMLRQKLCTITARTINSPECCSVIAHYVTFPSPYDSRYLYDTDMFRFTSKDSRYGKAFCGKISYSRSDDDLTTDQERSRPSPRTQFSTLKSDGKMGQSRKRKRERERERGNVRANGTNSARLIRAGGTSGGSSRSGNK